MWRPFVHVAVGMVVSYSITFIALIFFLPVCEWAWMFSLRERERVCVCVCVRACVHAAMYVCVCKSVVACVSKCIVLGLFFYIVSYLFNLCFFLHVVFSFKICCCKIIYLHFSRYACALLFVFTFIVGLIVRVHLHTNTNFCVYLRSCVFLCTHSLHHKYVGIYVKL